MGSVLAMAKDFLQRHEQLLKDVHVSYLSMTIIAIIHTDNLFLQINTNLSVCELLYIFCIVI